MESKNKIDQSISDIDEVEMKERKGVSLVWMLPIVAVLIAGWLGYKAYSEKGPTVTISFKEATGIEAGKTKIKYKDVEVGLVSDVVLDNDLSKVLITAKFRKEAKQHLNENTRFWVVRPRVGASGVSGLGTLFSGAYIEVEPGDGAAVENFVGLKEPPIVKADVDGREFIVIADELGSLHPGAPIYYRGIHAGEILGYDFLPDTEQIKLHAFIEAPFHNLVRTNSRFWNVSGFEMQVDANGIDVKTGSLQSILAGGIAFDTLSGTTQQVKLAEANSTFRLYDRYGETNEIQYDEKIPYVMFFSGSVRGLSVGAPVEFRGIKLGEVTDIHIMEDPESLEIYIPVTVELEPERIPYINGKQLVERSDEDVIGALVERGLKAQLQTGSMLTGQLFVDLEFHPNAEMKLARIEHAHPELPTIPTTIAEIEEMITKVARNFQNLPLDEIGQNLLETTQGMNHLINDPDMKNIIHSTNETLVQATQTLESVDGIVAPDSALQYDLANMMVEFKEMAQSIRVLTNYLERHPEALIAGKK